ncbi:MAG: hypothetical protein U9P81_07060, partial [Euryarchaeota archaeon]|nr:hypothetical protein [Euryarchaeota archaeon]
VVWVGNTGNYEGIYHWDERFNNDGRPVDPILISKNNSNSNSPQINDNKVVWVGSENGKNTIYYLDLNISKNYK